MCEGEGEGEGEGKKRRRRRLFPNGMDNFPLTLTHTHRQRHFEVRPRGDGKFKAVFTKCNNGRYLHITRTSIRIPEGVGCVESLRHLHTASLDYPVPTTLFFLGGGGWGATIWGMQQLLALSELVRGNFLKHCNCNRNCTHTRTHTRTRVVLANPYSRAESAMKLL